MKHPLETAVAAAVEEHGKLLKQIHELKGELSASQEREAILKGRIEAIDKELQNAKDRSDFYLRVNTAILQQMDNIEMFVRDAQQKAGDQVEKARNGKEIPEIAAVKKAITGE
jgi:hypothetical protein